MELIQLRYFLTVANLNHITQAAEVLNISQPSLSRTISRLENEVGVKLFNRQGRHIILNEYGKAFQIHVKRIFKEIDNGIDEISAISNAKKQTIHIAVSSVRMVSDLIVKFAKQNADIHINLTLVQTSDMVNLLENRHVDLCISALPIEHPEVKFIPLIEQEVFLGVSLKHPLAKRKSILLKEAANEPFISFAKGYELREITEKFCRQAGFIPNIMFEVDEPSCIGDFITDGLGVAFIPSSISDNHIPISIEQLKIKEPKCKQIIRLYWNKDRYLSETVLHFAEFIKLYFKKLESDH